MGPEPKMAAMCVIDWQFRTPPYLTTLLIKRLYHRIEDTINTMQRVITVTKQNVDTNKFNLFAFHHNANFRYQIKSLILVENLTLFIDLPSELHVHQMKDH